MHFTSTAEISIFGKGNLNISGSRACTLQLKFRIEIFSALINHLKVTMQKGW